MGSEDVGKEPSKPHTMTDKPQGPRIETFGFNGPVRGGGGTSPAPIDREPTPTPAPPPKEK